jgi:hypothetical protein
MLCHVQPLYQKFEDPQENRELAEGKTKERKIRMGNRVELSG